MGDVNGHNKVWNSNLPEITGNAKPAAEISQLNYGILNKNTPTRVTPNYNSSTDISLASKTSTKPTGLVFKSTWKTEYSHFHHLTLYVHVFEKTFRRIHNKTRADTYTCARYF